MGDNYYDILEVSKDAPVRDIGDAYFENVIQYHPDVLNNEFTLEFQDKKFRSMCLAYAALTDPVSRAQYDELSRDVQEQVAARLSMFRIGSETDITENGACGIWENFCISRGKICNKVLREFIAKREANTKEKKKVSSKVDMEGFDDDEHMEDIVTKTPEKQEQGDKHADNTVKPKLGIEDLVRAVKFNMRVEITRILFHHPDLVNEMDPQGYTSSHWAAKNGEVSILQTLHINGAKLNIASLSEHSMMPIHWAASDGQTSTIKYLLDNNVSINTQDSNGCTPVVIAAQHDKQNCCIYLSKNGADMALCDNNGDTALHWAAYKGFGPLLGLLSHLSPQCISTHDEYGQTPMHLAALRGNVECLEYLITDCHADMNAKDKNGLTPMQLSYKKKQLKCEWTLRLAAASQTSNADGGTRGNGNERGGGSLLTVVKQLEVSRLMDSKVLQYMLFASNDREMSIWPWRLVFGSNFVGTCYTLMFAFTQSMSDLWLLHMLNTAFQSCWWFCFWMCLGKDNLSVCDDPPSPLDPSGSTSRYTDALNSIAKDPSSNNIAKYNLCHTCHIVKPLRSKHCKIQRCCINKFDHFCPFVFNTVSRDNYKYFMGVVCLHAIVTIFWFMTAMFYCNREGSSVSFKFYIYIAYLGAWSLAVGSLVQYHLGGYYCTVLHCTALHCITFIYLLLLSL